MTRTPDPAWVLALIDDIKRSQFYYDILRAAEDEAEKPSVKISDLKRTVRARLVTAGWERKLKNEVYRYIQRHPVATTSHTIHDDDQTLHVEPLPHLQKAQVNWEKRILKSLNSMCTELGVPLARPRTDKDQRDLQNNWLELGAHIPDLGQIRPVYAPKDFLEVVIALHNPNYIAQDTPGILNHWGLIQVPLKVMTIHELRLLYSEMAINHSQTGVDDETDEPSEVFQAERTKLGKKVVAADHSPIAQEFSKKGCPVSLRAELWSQMLSINVTDKDRLYYEQLKTNVLHHDLLVDSLLYKDVKLTATNDDHYFVFEDFLYQILLPFSRDTTILEHFQYNSASPAKSFIRGKLGEEEYAVNYPPNGVIPFHGFAMYMSPLCYLYADPVHLYLTFRDIYTRYLFRLHSISSHPQGIVSLSLLFEHLLQTREPEVFYHLRSVNCQPLRIAFKWLVRAFSGYLSSDQVLHLWDRILAYNALEILSVLGASIFSFRKTNLMKVQSTQAAEAVLADLTTLQVIPLLQLMLFSK